MASSLDNKNGDGFLTEATSKSDIASAKPASCGDDDIERECKVVGCRLEDPAIDLAGMVAKPSSLLGVGGQSPMLSQCIKSCKPEHPDWQKLESDSRSSPPI